MNWVPWGLGKQCIWGCFQWQAWSVKSQAGCLGGVKFEAIVGNASHGQPKWMKTLSIHTFNLAISLRLKTNMALSRFSKLGTTEKYQTFTAHISPPGCVCVAVCVHGTVTLVVLKVSNLSTPYGKRKRPPIFVHLWSFYFSVIFSIIP